MTQIVILPKEYELFLSYSWGPMSQGISGHLYECIEYYTILKQHYKTGIVICEDEGITKDQIRTAMLDKYNFTDDEIVQILNDIHFFPSAKVVKGSNLLLTDGNMYKLRNVHLLFDNIMLFPCGDLRFSDMTTVTAFQDYRIYGPCQHHKNYVKKILFNRYKSIEANTDKTNLVYATRGPREISDSIYNELAESYDGNFIVLTNADLSIPNNSRFTRVEMPVKDLFSKFSNYIYTPTQRKWDCSPRFIAECHWYKKDVKYHNIDYWSQDKGLYWRKYDIENNFNNIILNEDDDIIQLVGNIINV